MGCDMSTQRCSLSQKEEVFRIACIEMLNLCIEIVVKKPCEIKIKPPTAKETRASMAVSPTTSQTSQETKSPKRPIRGKQGTEENKRKSAGNDGKDDNNNNRSQPHSPREPPRSPRLSHTPSEASVGDGYSSGATGGVFLQLLGRARELTGMAIRGGVEASLTSLERPLTALGREIVERHQAEILEIWKEAIGSTKIKNPVGLVRGAHPYGPDQYRAAKKNGITAHFLTQQRQKLTEKMAALVKPAVERSSATAKAWQVCIDNLNALAGPGSAETPVSLDLEQYVTEQLVQQIAILMGREECVLRQSPGGKSRRPWTFELCFSPEPILDHGLPKSAYKHRDK